MSISTVLKSDKFSPAARTSSLKHIHMILLGCFVRGKHRLDSQFLGSSALVTLCICTELQAAFGYAGA
jgi:hypothetical protein